MSSREEAPNYSDPELWAQENVILPLTTCGAVSCDDLKQGEKKNDSVAIHVNLWRVAMFLLAWITFRLVSEVPGRAALELWGLRPTLPLLLTQRLVAAHALPVLSLTLCRNDDLCAFSLWWGTKNKLGKEGCSRPCVLKVLLCREGLVCLD